MTLSPQQNTALWLLACGNPIVGVAELMGIKPNTVKEHLNRAYRSLGARNGLHAVHIAYQYGLFNPPGLNDLRDYVDKIQAAAMKLGIMSSVGSGGLAEALGELARDLNLALAAIGETTAESPRQGMARALEQHGVLNVNPLFLGVTYEGHPEISYALEDWDWADAEVHEKVLAAVVKDMLGIGGLQYEQALNGNPVQLMRAFWAAHEVWS